MTETRCEDVMLVLGRAQAALRDVLTAIEAEPLKIDRTDLEWMAMATAIAACETLRLMGNDEIDVAIQRRLYQERDLVASLPPFIVAGTGAV